MVFTLFNPARGLRPLLLVALLSWAAPALAWSDHGSLLWPQLQQSPGLLAPTLEVETLEAFVDAEAAGLEALLAEHEGRERQQNPLYAARPDVLAFRAGATDRRRAFLEALRVNPTLSYAPYRQLFIGEPVVPGAVRWGDLSFMPIGSSHAAILYAPLVPGARVSPAQVIASASDEPDFGIDIGLFADNDTPFGARYGFGTQPFGNPNLPFSSQAPFHMGFYHLDWFTRTLQPDVLRTFPAWRVSLFGALSDFAFETGHGYWGWRFAGWALHYVGDLTQPYHADPLPGMGTAGALWELARGRIGDAVQLVSNRHGVLESYQFRRFSAALAGGDPAHALLAPVARPVDVPLWNDATLVDGLARESVAASPALDAVLAARMPPRYVADPTFEWTGSGEEAAIVESVRRAGGDAALEALDASLATQLARFGRYAKAWVDRVRRSHQNAMQP